MDMPLCRSTRRSTHRSLVAVVACNANTDRDHAHFTRGEFNLERPDLCSHMLCHGMRTRCFGIRENETELLDEAQMRRTRTA